MKKNDIENKDIEKIEAGAVLVKEQNHKFTRNIYTNSHSLIADEPKDLGGSNLGPDPYEYLLSALGTCTSMTVRMYANRKNIPLDNIEIKLGHSRIHGEDCAECESDEGIIDVIEKEIRLDGKLSKDERARLMEIADKCPVHKTLLNEILVKSRLVT